MERRGAGSIPAGPTHTAMKMTLGRKKVEDVKDLVVRFISSSGVLLAEIKTDVPDFALPQVGEEIALTDETGTLDFTVERRRFMFAPKGVFRFARVIELYLR